MKKKKIILLTILILLLSFFTIFAHKFILNIFSGRVHFAKEYVGSDLTMDDGKKFTVLRRLQVEERNGITDGYAVFIVRFKFKDLEFETNKKLSMIPTPFLINMEGFREKIWTFNTDTDFFQGIYQWSTKEYAETYPQSFIFKLMTKRSAEGTLSYEVIPDMLLSEYIKNLIK